MRGLGLGLGFHRGRRGNTFNIADVALGAKGFYLDPLDLTTLFQDDGATTPVTSTGQGVGTWLDGSSASIDFTQSVSGSRPTYIGADFDGAASILTDGADDSLSAVFSGSAGPSAASLFLAVLHTGTGNFVTFMSGANDETAVNGENGATGAAVAINTGSPTPTMSVDGAVVANQDEAYDALTDGEWHLVELSGADFSLWEGFQIASFAFGYRFSGRIGRLVVIETADLTTDIRTDLIGWVQKGYS